MWGYVGVISISFLISGLWAKYISATASENAEAAATYDLLLMLASSSIYQIWATLHNSFALLVVGDVAAAAGTYCFIKWTKAHRGTKKAPKKQRSWVARNLNRILGKK